jgi:outer membrane protein assembly factor BamB
MFYFLLLFLLINVSVYAADWNAYRGGDQATGCAAETVSLPKELKTIWKHPFKSGWIQATAIIVDGTVFVGSSDDGMSAFALKDGKLLWTFPVENGVIAPAVFHKGLVFFGDSTGVLYALDAATGKERWKFQTKGTIDNSPNIDRKTDRVLVGSQDGNLYALDAASGKNVWTYKIDNQIRCFPTIAERNCFVAGCDSKFHIVDLDKGTAKATVDIESPTGSTPAVLGDNVYFGTEGNEFIALNWKTAKIVWRLKSKQAFRSPAACKGDAVVVCGMDKAVRCLDAATGKERWEYRTKGRMEESGAVVVGENVYVPSTDTFLYILDFKTGKKINAIELGSKLRACPAVVNQMLVIGTDDGTLFGLGERKF